MNEQADIVVANILAEIIMTFTDDAFSIVKDGGLFITSGIIATKKEDVRESLQQAGFEIEEVMMMEDWVTIISRKPVSIRRLSCNVILRMNLLVKIIQ